MRSSFMRRIRGIVFREYLDSVAQPGDSGFDCAVDIVRDGAIRHGFVTSGGDKSQESDPESDSESGMWLTYGYPGAKQLCQEV